MIFKFNTYIKGYHQHFRSQLSDNNINTKYLQICVRQYEILIFLKSGHNRPDKASAELCSNHSHQSGSRLLSKSVQTNKEARRVENKH